MLQVARAKANTGKTVTIFESLKKQYGLRAVRRRGSPLRNKPLKNNHIIGRFLDYYKYAEKFPWRNQPWYQGTGLHYSTKCNVRPFARQVCGGGYDNDDYENTMLFDQPINKKILKDVEFFPTVRCKITRMFGSVDGGLQNENLLWHKDERPYEVLRVIVPLESSNEYMFQLDNYEPMNLEVGMIYAFDQSILHRIFKTKITSQNRTHLILSYVTWFTKEKDEWIPNKNAGNIHPLDLFDQIDL